MPVDILSASGAFDCQGFFLSHSVAGFRAFPSDTFDHIIPENSFWRKIVINCKADLFEPLFPLFLGTKNQYVEHPSIKPGYTAKFKNTVLPQGLKWIPKNIILSFRRSVEYHGCPGSQKTLWNPFPLVALNKLIGNAGSDNPVHPSFQ